MSKHGFIFEDNRFTIEVHEEENSSGTICTIWDTLQKFHIHLNAEMIEAILGYYGRFTGETTAAALQTVATKHQAQAYFKDPERIAVVANLIERVRELTIKGEPQLAVQVIQEEREKNPEAVDVVICISFFLLSSLLAENCEFGMENG